MKNRKPEEITRILIAGNCEIKDRAEQMNEFFHAVQDSNGTMEFTAEHVEELGIVLNDLFKYFRKVESVARATVYSEPVDPRDSEKKIACYDATPRQEADKEL